MQVKIKKLHPNTKTPQYANPGDAAVDLIATSFDVGLYFIEYGTNIALEIPEGYVGLLFPRSSVSNKGLILSNSVGVIDSGYRGEIKFRFYPNDGLYEEYKIGDKIGQMLVLPHPKIEFQEVNELSMSIRNTGSYGSTGV